MTTAVKPEKSAASGVVNQQPMQANSGQANSGSKTKSVAVALVVIAVIAALAAAIVYAEVKWRCVSFVLTIGYANPIYTSVLAVSLLVGLIALFILTRRSSKVHVEQNKSTPNIRVPEVRVETPTSPTGSSVSLDHIVEDDHDENTAGTDVAGATGTGGIDGTRDLQVGPGGTSDQQVTTSGTTEQQGGVGNDTQINTDIPTNPLLNSPTASSSSSSNKALNEDDITTPSKKSGSRGVSFSPMPTNRKLKYADVPPDVQSTTTMETTQISLQELKVMFPSMKLFGPDFWADNYDLADIGVSFDDLPHISDTTLAKSIISVYASLSTNIKDNSGFSIVYIPKGITLAKALDLFRKDAEDSLETLKKTLRAAHGQGFKRDEIEALKPSLFKVQGAVLQKFGNDPVANSYVIAIANNIVLHSANKGFEDITQLMTSSMPEGEEKDEGSLEFNWPTLLSATLTAGFTSRLDKTNSWLRTDRKHPVLDMPTHTFQETFCLENLDDGKIVFISSLEIGVKDDKPTIHCGIAPQCIIHEAPSSE